MRLINSAKYNNGFTLVELLITLLIGMIVLGSLYTIFQSQQRNYIVQDSVVETQQNLRSVLAIMTPELRMAGYDPTGNANAGIVTATAGVCEITMDLNVDGDTEDSNESVSFGFSSSYDSDGDGIVDGGGAAPLGRNTGAGYQPIAENIQAIEFLYIMADGSSTTTPSNLNDIRSISISILARTGNSDRNFANTEIYTTASGATWGPFNDNYHRRFLSTIVKCRNMGL